MQTERDNSMRLSAQNSGLHMYVCMATLYVTVCGVECEQEMYAKGDVAFFCLSNSLCLLGYLGKAHLIAAQWAEMANKM